MRFIPSKVDTIVERLILFSENHRNCSPPRKLITECWHVGLGIANTQPGPTLKFTVLIRQLLVEVLSEHAVL